MKTRLIASGMVALLPLALFSLAPASSAQTARQSAAPAPAAPKRWCSGCSVDGKTTPRTPDGHPDFSGFYNWGDDHYIGDTKAQTGGALTSRGEDGSVFFIFGGIGNGGGEADAPAPAARPGGAAPRNDITCQSCNNPPYKPEYLEKVKVIGDTEFGDASPLDPQYDCKPLGVPRGSLRGSNDPAMQIVQNSAVVAFLYEDRPGPYFRIVYMDGRPHPKDLDESYYGDSIGHWNGDTLVVDVVGLNDETWLGSGTIGPKYAMMHSNKEHVVERWNRNGDTVTYQAIVEDPVMFTHPWVTTPRTTQIAPGDAISPQMCVPFDKDHLVKKDGSTYIPSGGKSAETAAAAIAAEQGASKVSGTWDIVMHNTADGTQNEQWTFQQNGGKIIGTIKNKTGVLPLEGDVSGTILHATVTDGAMKYDVVGTLDQSDNVFDGTIRMGKHEYLLSGKRAQ
jgi:hypothetical protein